MDVEQRNTLYVFQKRRPQQSLDPTQNGNRPSSIVVYVEAVVGLVYSGARLTLRRKGFRKGSSDFKMAVVQGNLPRSDREASSKQVAGSVE